jgi:transcriptional regulator of arginine metabolism
MKKDRQERILQLIKEKPIYNQEELTNALIEEGFRATQPTVSRDINELGLVKSIENGKKSRYEAPKKINKAENYFSYFSESVISIETAMNLVIIKCKTGMAQAACASLDLLNLHSIIGTIAGDDTIFIATKDEDTAKFLKSEISVYINR